MAERVKIPATGIKFPNPLGRGVTIRNGRPGSGAPDPRGGKYYAMRRDRDGKLVYYFHISQYLEKVGSRPKQWTPLFKTGNTGSATTGAHTHLEMRKSVGGARYKVIDPRPYLKKYRRGPKHYRFGNIIFRVSADFGVRISGLWGGKAHTGIDLVPTWKIIEKKEYLRVHKGGLFLGLAKLAKRAKYKNWWKPARWDAIARLNKKNRWWQLKLRVGKRIRVR